MRVVLEAWAQAVWRAFSARREIGNIPTTVLSQNAPGSGFGPNVAVMEPVAAAATRSARAASRWSTFRHWSSTSLAVPEPSSLPRVGITPRLIGFLALLWSAAAAAFIPSVGHSFPWPVALLAGGLLAVLSAWSVPVARTQGRWSASVYFELAFAFTVGPLAIVGMAAGYALGDHLRRRPGLIRSAFNVANHTLFNLAALATFDAVAGGHADMPQALAAGVAGGLVQLVVGVGLLGLVLWSANQGPPPRELVGAIRQLLPWNVAFGFAAGGVSVLYRVGGVLGLLVLLVPVVMLQMSLVATARRMHAEAEKDAAHAREREALLQTAADASALAAAASQRAAEASERERRQVAADLHDGVIQDVSGVMMSLAAAADRVGDHDPVLKSFLQRADEIGHRVTRDLRSMMIELAPPELEVHGVRGALQQLLGRLQREDIKSHLDCEDLDLDPPRLRLVHRVVQEAMRNAIKHAGCSNLWVTVGFRGEILVASVRDDGRGFSPEERAQRLQEDHNGLGLLEQTVRDGAGLLRVTSEVGAGTVVELFAPAPASPPPVPELFPARPTEPLAQDEPLPVPSSRRRRSHRDAGRGAAEPQHV